MNILEARKASNCGKIRRSIWREGDCVQHDHDMVSMSQIFKDDWEPINEPLTFKIIKEKCVAGETLLIGDGFKRLYLGFNRVGDLVTDQYDGCDSTSFKENEISDWIIDGKFERGKG